MTVLDYEDPADPSAHEPKVTGSPDCIWLVYGDLERDATHAECYRDGEVTWCAGPQFASDVRYVRADVVASASAADDGLPEPLISRNDIRGAVARGWCHPDNARKEMDAALALAIADEVCALVTDQMRAIIAAERAKVPGWWKCRIHGDALPHNAWGCPECVREMRAELSTLRQQLEEAVRDAKRYRWLRRIDSFAEWNRVGHYAADALDAAIDAAIAAQGEAKPPGVERELFEGE